MLDHDSDIPLYQQLEDILEHAIRSGTFQDGRKLPSENRLCKTYGVSRITVRQALALLEQKDLVYTVHGKGTFAKIPTINQHLFKIVSFAKVLEGKGLQGHTEVLAFEQNADSPKDQKLLQAGPQGSIGRLQLIGCAQSAPIVYYDSYLPEKLAADMHAIALEKALQGQAFSTFDLYQETGIWIKEIQQVIRAVNSDRRMAEILKVPKGTALIVLESVVLDEDKALLEHKLAYYRGDQYAFHLKRET